MNLGAPSVVRCFKEESAVTMNLFGSIELILFVAIASLRNNMANKSQYPLRLRRHLGDIEVHSWRDAVGHFTHHHY